MPEDSDEEKTEPATPRRLEQAREEGRVPQCRELSTFTLLMAAALGFSTMGRRFVLSTIELMKAMLQLDNKSVFDISSMLSRFGEACETMLLLVLMLTAVIWIAGLVTPLLLTGLNISPKGLEPNFERLNPLKGFGRIFSLNSIIELIKSVLKSFLVGGVAVWIILREMNEFLSLSTFPLIAAIETAGELIFFCFFTIAGTTIILVTLDLPYQLWRYHKELRMTKEEVKREMKESEGDPMVKGRIRRLQQEAARNRMMAAVPDSSVVVTNPQHYAVALKYNDDMKAPLVVAKGIGLIAAKIREIAMEANVPIFEAPPLARALYRHADLEAPIPTALYAAVAEVLAYLHQLKIADEEGLPPPTRPEKLDVPPELDPANRITRRHA